MAGIPDPDTLTRQQRQPSTGTIQTVEFDEPGDQISVEDALKEAQDKLARETARADSEAAERARERQGRQEAERRANDAHGQVLTSHGQTLDTGIRAATAAVEKATGDLVAAINAGDAIAQADAQKRISLASADLSTITAQKSYFEAEQTRRTEEAKRAPPPTQQTSPNMVTVTTPAGSFEVSAQTKQWMDAHPRFYNDKAYYNHVIASHGTVIGEGIQQESPAYFRELDKMTQDFERYEAFQRGEQPVDNNNLSQRQQARRSAYGAPPGRTTQLRTDQRGPSVEGVARSLGGSINEADLREFAQSAGYRKGGSHNGKRFESDDAAFQQYLADHAQIAADDREGRPTGMVRDQNFRWE